MVMDKIRITTTRRSSTTTVTTMTGGMVMVAKKKTVNGSTKKVMNGTGTAMRLRRHSGQNLVRRPQQQRRSKVKKERTRLSATTTREKVKVETMVASTVEANGAWPETALWVKKAVASRRASKEKGSPREKASTDGDLASKEKAKERASLGKERAKEKDLANAIGSAELVDWRLTRASQTLRL